MKITDIVLVGITVLVAVLITSSSSAAEFHEDDILPTVSSLVFTQDTIVMTLESSTYLGNETMHYAARRNDYEFREITDQDRSNLLETNYYHRKLSGNIWLRDGDGEYEFSQRGLTLRVGGLCEPRSRVPTHVSHNDFQFTIDLQCAARIYDAVQNNGRLWMATFVDRDFAYIHELSQEGVIVASLDGTEETRIDVGDHTIHGLAVDPWTQDVWIVSQDRIVQASDEQKVLRQYWPVLDFAETTGRPGTFVKKSSDPLLSHPLALVARSLGEDHYRTFYDAVKDLPDSWDQEIMYRYAMNGPDWFSTPSLPKQLNALIKEAEQTVSWRRFVCLLNDERAFQMCKLGFDEWPAILN